MVVSRSVDHHLQSTRFVLSLFNLPRSTIAVSLFGETHRKARFSTWAFYGDDDDARMAMKTTTTVRSFLSAMVNRIRKFLECVSIEKKTLYRFYKIERNNSCCICKIFNGSKITVLPPPKKKQTNCNMHWRIWFANLAAFINVYLNNSRCKSKWISTARKRRILLR